MYETFGSPRTNCLALKSQNKKCITLHITQHTVTFNKASDYRANGLGPTRVKV